MRIRRLQAHIHGSAQTSLIAFLLLLAVIAVAAATWSFSHRILCLNWNVWETCSAFDHFGSYFDKNIRGSLFSGFLTLGGFLLSLKAFIVVNMKKEVYDTPSYAAVHSDATKNGQVSKRYGPLEDLADIIFAAIVACITTAVLQITVGLFAATWSSTLCLLSAAYAISLLVMVLILIRHNLKTMFRYLDNASQIKKD